MAGIVLEFDRNPALSDVERLQSFMESVQRAFNELEITYDDLDLKNHPAMISANQDFRVLFDDYAHFKVVSANAVEAIRGSFENLDVDYARIDQANIKQAWVEDLMVTGKFLADDVNAATGSFSKYLTGVNIVGDNITAGTITTDRLVIRDPDTNTGILFAINDIGEIDQSKLSEEELKRLTLDGKVITAESITAEQINVYDLFAQNITSTGDFNMGGKGALVYNAEKDELSIRVKDILLASGKTVEGTFGDYSTTEQMNAAIKESAEAITTSVSNSYTKKTDFDLVETRLTDAEEKITDEAIISTVSEKYITKDDAGKTYETIANVSEVKQTINGLTITTSNGTTLINGGKIETTSLFAQDITLEASNVYISPGYTEAQRILQYSSELITLTDKELSASDLDGDGLVLTNDAMLALQAVTGIANYSDFAGAKTGSVATKINLKDPHKVIRIHGTNAWGREVESYLGVDGLKVERVVAEAIKLNEVMLTGSDVFLDEKGLRVDIYKPKTIFGFENNQCRSGNAAYDLNMFGSTIKVTSSVAGLSSREYGVNKVLWAGAKSMKATDTITLSEAISAQPNGVILVFSKSSGSAAEDTAFSYHFVPKWHGINKSGKYTNFVINYGANLYRRLLYIFDTQIVGEDNNGASSYTLHGKAIDQSTLLLREVIGV